MPYQQLTREDLRTRLQARYEDASFWTPEEADDAINEALCTWGMLTGRWKRRLVLNTAANTYEYAFPATITYGMRVTYNGQPMSPSARVDLDLGRPNWRQESTATGNGVPNRPILWAPVSLGLIWIWPTDAAGHNALVLDGVSTTPQLTDDAQYVDLAEADLSPLLGFCLHVLAFKKGGPWFQKTQGYFRDFIEAAAVENSLITTAQWYRRYMGLDRRDLKPYKGAPTSVAALAPGSGA